MQKIGARLQPNKSLAERRLVFLFCVGRVMFIVEVKVGRAEEEKLGRSILFKEPLPSWEKRGTHEA